MSAFVKAPVRPVSLKAMAPVLLVHWKWSETIDLATALQAEGFDVITESDDGVRAVRMAIEHPPSAIAICLDAAPGHGRDLALALAETEASAVPVVFFGGGEKARRRIRKAIPHAEIVEREMLSTALSRFTTPQVQ